MPRSFTFDVVGTPVAKGSMTAGVTQDGRPYLRDQKSKRLKTWAKDVTTIARMVLRGEPPIPGPVRVDLDFYMPRPKDHVRTNGQLKDWAPTWHTTKPDEDKLRRAVLDALTHAHVYGDDSQVCDGRTRKRYADPGGRVGVRITVTSLDEAEEAA